MSCTPWHLVGVGVARELLGSNRAGVLPSVSKQILSSLPDTRELTVLENTTRSMRKNILNSDFLKLSPPFSCAESFCALPCVI